MRVIAGEWRGRKLTAPVGDTTRPTADRTRETLFSMLASRLGSFDGLRVADFFAGSGALGIEALSRGAGHCLFVEQDPSAVKVIKANLSALDAGSRAEVRTGSVMALGPASHPLDLLLLDPPYRTGAGEVALDKLGRLGWIAPSAWISLETALGEDISVKGFAVDVRRAVGKAMITLGHWQPQ